MSAVCGYHTENDNTCACVKLTLTFTLTFRDLDSNNELPPHNTNDDHGLTHCLPSSQNPYDSSYDNTSSHPHEDKNNSNTHEITTPYLCSDGNAGYMVSGCALLPSILLHAHEVAHQDLSRKDTDDKRNDLHQKASNLHV